MTGGIEMTFERIDMEQWPRREHYRYYNEQIRTSYEMNVELDVTKLRKRCLKKGIHFYPAMMYAIMYSINHHENFRMALDEEGHLGVYDICHPSYTIFHKDDETFSDIWTEWNEDFSIFYKDVCRDMKQYKDSKGIKAKPYRPDALRRYPVYLGFLLHLWDMTHRDRGRCIFRSLFSDVTMRFMIAGCCLSA